MSDTHSNLPESDLTDHSYDGIQEYDNPTPGWWNWLFLGSFVFAAFYWVFYHSGVEGRSIHAEFSRSQAELMRRKFGEIGDLAPDAATVVAYMDPAKDGGKWLTFGKVVYEANCAQCHQRDGGGSQGPNLTDDLYKNVRHIEDIPRVVAEGANNGAMPQWGSRLHPNEIVLVSAYVATLRGTTPSNPKAPIQGEVAIDPWPTLADVTGGSTEGADAGASGEASGQTTSGGTTPEDPTSAGTSPEGTTAADPAAEGTAAEEEGTAAEEEGTASDGTASDGTVSDGRE